MDLYFISYKKDNNVISLSLFFESIWQSIFCRKYRRSGLQRALEPRGLGRMSLESGFRIRTFPRIYPTLNPPTRFLVAAPSCFVARCTPQTTYALIVSWIHELSMSLFPALAATCWGSLSPVIVMQALTFPTLDVNWSFAINKFRRPLWREYIYSWLEASLRVKIFRSTEAQPTNLVITARKIVLTICEPRERDIDVYDVYFDSRNFPQVIRFFLTYVYISLHGLCISRWRILIAEKLRRSPQFEQILIFFQLVATTKYHSCKLDQVALIPSPPPPGARVFIKIIGSKSDPPLLESIQSSDNFCAKNEWARDRERESCI